MTKIHFWTACTLCILFSILFYFFPQIDLNISDIFFKNNQFPTPAWMELARHLLSFAMYTMLTILVLIILWSILQKKYKIIRPALFILLCFALGPGLLVNIILKDHWGRPRPFLITQFGGQKTYQKPWVVSNECHTNCSFPAGEPAAAFTFFAFLFLIKKKYQRKYIFCLITLNWLLFSYIRLAEGGHFLSDILIGATLIYMLIWICYQLVFYKKSVIDQDL